MRLLPADLEHVAVRARGDLESLRGQRLFITGGTGFIGKWLLECLLHANALYGLEMRLGVLSRDPQSFLARHPHLAGVGEVEYFAGDVMRFSPPDRAYDLVIHGATNASARLNIEDPLLMADTIVEGSRRVLELARQAGAKKLLFLSSGAVYGKFPPGVSHVRETDRAAPDPLNPYYAYSEAKRMAELLCALYRKQHGLEFSSARIFALVGPHLPLAGEFAIGNFIGDVLAGRDIRIKGDGAATRSYLHSADLTAWLLAILVRGQSGAAYNVGSDVALSIGELAQTVRDVAGSRAAVVIEGRRDATHPVDYYVPDIARARTELGLDVTISLAEAIGRTIEWHRQGRA